MAEDFETIRYETDGAVATITMNRPDVANAQDSRLIDEIDAAFDRADADDAVRVVILAGAGKHFSSGHDLKALVSGEGDDPWVALRETPEGKFQHEKTMYFDRCLRIHDFRKPTIAAVQGSCIAAGLMLAAMCDLIVAADDAVFSNPVLRLTGAGVELLVEPWEIGIRKAKEFLFTGDTIDAQEAWRLGLVNRVVPRAELEAAARELADRVALVPPVTAQTVKDTINQTANVDGQAGRPQVPLHGPPLGPQFGHRARRAGGAQGEGLHAGGHGGAGPGSPGSGRMSAQGAGPLAGIRVVDVGTRISAPFCAGLLGELGADVIKVELPGEGDFMRTMGPFVPVDDGPDYSLSWSVEGRGRRGVTCDLRRPEGRELFKRLAATADVVCENFRPGTMERWGLGPDDLPDDLVFVRISVFGQSGPYAPRPGLDRLGIAFGGLLHLTGDPDRPPVRPGVTVSDYLTGVFAAFAAVAALYGRDGGREGRGPEGDVIDAPLYGSVLRILEWTLAGYDRLGIVRQREGNRLSHSAPLDNYPTADGFFVCIVAGSDANFGRLCAAMERPDLAADPRFATLAERAARGDEINGLVAEWTAALTAGGDHGPLRRARRARGDRLQRRRHLRRSPHGRPGRPRLGRRPGDRSRAPAGSVPPAGPAPDASAHGSATARRAQPRGVVRPGGPERCRARRADSSAASSEAPPGPTRPS